MRNELPQAARYFEILTAPLPPQALGTAWLQVKRIVPKHRERTEAFFSRRYFFPVGPRGIGAAALACRTAALGGYDVYGSVLPRDRQDGLQEAVPSATWLWCDLDGGDAGEDGAWELLRWAMENPVLRGGVPLSRPHLIVSSGGGLHVYHRLAETIVFDASDGGPASREIFHKTLRRYALLFPSGGGAAGVAHADASRADCATTFRVPGTINYKPSRCGSVVAIRQDNPDVWPMKYDWWRASLPSLPVIPLPRAYERRDGDPWIPRATQERLDTPSPAGGSHRHKTPIALALAHAGHSLESIVMLLDTNDCVSGKQNREHSRDNHSMARTALRKAGRPV